MISSISPCGCGLKWDSMCEEANAMLGISETKEMMVLSTFTQWLTGYTTESNRELFQGIDSRNGESCKGFQNP